MVDAVDVMNATMGDGEEGSGGWRTFWEETMNVDDDESDTASVRSLGSVKSSSSRRSGRSQSQKRGAKGQISRSPQRTLQVNPADRLGTLRLPSMHEGSEGTEMDLKEFDGLAGASGSGGGDMPFVFKVVDPSGNMHKVIALALSCQP